MHASFGPPACGGGPAGAAPAPAPAKGAAPFDGNALGCPNETEGGAVHRREWRGIGGRGLIGERRREGALRAGFPHGGGEGGDGQGHDQTANDQGCFSGKVHPCLRQKAIFRFSAFYDRCQTLTTRGIRR
jgi:hypothetical protein